MIGKSAMDGKLPPALQLEQICLRFWQFQFRFDQGSIGVESDLEHVDGAGNIRRHNADENRLEPLAIQSSTRSVGQSVTEIIAEPFWLTLSFERDDLLRVLSEEGPFECGQIYDEDGRLLAVL